MSMTTPIAPLFRFTWLPLWLALAGAAAPGVAGAQARSAAAAPRTADYILAVVNSELVTAGELQLRMGQLREEARRSGGRLPPEADLRAQLLNALIDERVQITHAREAGQKVSDTELDRAVANVASQNQLTVTQLRERLRTEGIEYVRFRNNIRDQMMVERVREREVQSRIRITDADIDAWLERQRAAAGDTTQYDIAQVLVAVPEGAGEAAVKAGQARAESVLARIKAGEAFDAVAKQVSEDLNKANGGAIGPRPANRLPDAFVEAVRTLKAGEVAPALVRTPAGFHVLKLLDRRQGSGAATVTQTHARHILLRLSAKVSEEAAVAKLQGLRKQIEGGKKPFEELAREVSEDGSAPQGGDLGWVAPGAFVPEFESVMDGLAQGALSEPVVSRFGVHLIQVLERREMQLDVKQQREQARNALREQRFEAANAEWVRELRTLAYVELREAPQ
jgi:peptidyl-prolyl cis-trans isomerase SurA